MNGNPESRELREFEIKGAVLYEQDGILLQTAKDNGLHYGLLSVIETMHGVFITWEKKDDVQKEEVTKWETEKSTKPSDQFIVGSPPDSTEWAVIADQVQPPNKDSVKFKRNTSVIRLSSSSSDANLRLTAELNEVRSYRLLDDGNAVTLLMRDGTTHNTLLFMEEGSDSFIRTINRQMSVRRSATDSDLYLLSDKRTAALDQSLSELNLFDRPNRETVWRTIGEIQKDPYTAGLTILSKVADRLLFSPLEKEYRPEAEMAELLQSEGGGGSLECHGEDGGDNWQLVNNARSLLKCVDARNRGSPLCQLDWELHINEDGVVEDVSSLLNKISRGGVEDNIRSDVWKYLLGFYKWHHTHEIREINRKTRVEEYYRMKLQWKSMSDDQQNRFTGFRERKTQIEKDIGRTDRAHPFYANDRNPNVQLLHEILMTYVMYNFDLGYVQGMSDLLSPLLYVMKNEVDAFWCFVGFMEKVATNFEFDQGGMKNQLTQLSVILKYVDICFYNYLESKESGNLFFCFRWLLIWFKREFNYSDTMRLWEVLWTSKPCKNFHLLICVALLDSEKSSIVENMYGFTEILKHVNDMSHRINLDQILGKAEGIYNMLRDDPDVPDAVLDVFGIEPENLSCDKLTLVNGKLKSLPVPITGKLLERERCMTESSNGTDSLNNSSSVEVLSEADDNRFEEALSNSYF